MNKIVLIRPIKKQKGPNKQYLESQKGHNHKTEQSYKFVCQCTMKKSTINNIRPTN